MKENKFAITMVILVVVVLGGAVLFGKDSVERIRLGNEHNDDGRNHVAQSQATEYGGGEPPTSGDHGEPVPQQAYTTELPDYNTIHNLEHGYIYITYLAELRLQNVRRY